MTDAELREILTQIYTWVPLVSSQGASKADISIPEYKQLKLETKIEYEGDILTLVLIFDKDTPVLGENLFSVVGYIGELEFHANYSVEYTNGSISSISLVEAKYLAHTGVLETVENPDPTPPQSGDILIYENDSANIYNIYADMTYDSVTGALKSNYIRITSVSNQLAKADAGEYCLDISYGGELVEKVTFDVPENCATSWTAYILDNPDAERSLFWRGRTIRSGTFTLNSLGNGSVTFGVNTQILKYNWSDQGGTFGIGDYYLLEIYRYASGSTPSDEPSFWVEFEMKKLSDFVDLVKNGALITSTTTATVFEHGGTELPNNVYIYPDASSKRGTLSVQYSDATYSGYVIKGVLKWISRPRPSGRKSGVIADFNITKDAVSNNITAFNFNLDFSLMPFAFSFYKKAQEGGGGSGGGSSTYIRHSIKDYTNETKWSVYCRE